MASTPAVGSSSSRSFGSCRTQAASASRCFQPPESWPGELVAPVRQAHPVEDRAHRLAPVGQLVDAGDEVEVLVDRQILVQAEALRHVADLAADRVRLAEDVVAEAGPRAVVGLEQAAQHADGRGLAAAVGAEEAADLALGDPQVEALDHLEVAEALAQAAHVDDIGRHGAPGAGAAGVTVTGCPGLSSLACSGGARASARNTNLPRVDSE